MNTDSTNPSSTEQELNSLSQILSREESQSISLKVKEIMEVYEKSLNSFECKYDDKDTIPGEETPDPILEKYPDLWMMELLSSVKMDTNKTKTDIELDEIEFVTGIKQSYTNTKLDLSLREYAKKHSEFNDDEINYLNEDQVRLLKGWLIFDSISLFEKLQKMQADTGTEEIEELDVPLPTWTLRKLAWARKNISDRVDYCISSKLLSQL